METIDIKGKEYVMVHERIKFFRSEKVYEGWAIDSEVMHMDFDKGLICIKAIIKDTDGRVRASGIAFEKESSSYINKTSFIENCETSAWGRALGNMGIGIDASMASAEEVANAIKQQGNIKKPGNKPQPVPPKKKTPQDEFLATMRGYYTTLGTDLFDEVLAEQKVKSVKDVTDKATQTKLIAAMDFLKSSMEPKDAA